MKKAIAFYFLYVFIFCYPAGAETITITADKDTYLDMKYPNDNFGQKWNVLASGDAGKLANGIFFFDYSAIPEHAIITKAHVTFLVHANRGSTTYSFHSLSTAWDEDVATWNLAQPGINWTIPGGDYDPLVLFQATIPAPTPGWVNEDVTAILADQQGQLKKDVLENGLLVRSDPGYSKILSAELSTFPDAQTCHSCHGTFDPELDVGKSTNCAQCHSQDDIALAGEPTLVVDYEPMLFQFAQVSDTHIGKTTQQTTNLSNAVAQINTKNPAFVLFSGDLTDSGSLEQYSIFKTAIAGLSMLYYCVPGDNDIVDGEGDLQRYREQMGNDYFAFDYQGFNVIGLNDNLYLSLDETQRQWFENELQEAKPGIVFAHMPLLDYYNSFAPLPEGEQLLGLLDTYQVPLFLNGHTHETAEYTRNDTAFIWCDNLSFAHLGDPYNLYRVYGDRILLYHVDLRDGAETFVGNFPLPQPDADHDGVPDISDNCPQKPNGPELGTCLPGSDKEGATCHSDADCVIGCSVNGTCSLAQEDADSDGAGDVCDNCPDICNAQQLDADTDDLGDVCDTDPGCGGCSGVACEEPC